ncbi:MAG TPA: DUF4433 domain-containing protein [bacterium]|nr:DUF4433 domain-containing protein [bacterium]
MTILRKADAQEIVDHLETLKRQYAADPERKFWPQCLFHFTDVNNAAKILDIGYIYSRAELERRGIEIADAASPDVLHVTDRRVKEHVRLYFRPKTPTQYSNEGIRPKDKQKYGAHCPVPVMLLFDAKEILTRQSTCFSDANLAAAGTNVFSSADYFKKLPFDKIYHMGWQDYDDEVKRRRNAEVIVPTELDLTALKGIRCRSQADLETLRHLLSYDAFMNWHKILGVDSRRNLFDSRWLFVRQATLLADSLHLQFENVKLDERFHARLRVTSLRFDRQGEWEESVYQITNPLRFTVKGYADGYRAEFYLDGNLVYHGEYCGANEQEQGEFL